jgi:vacuolar-type H+-ATPase subunit H
MNTFEVLDRIESAVRNAFHIPFTGLAILDADRLLAIIERVRSMLPEELKQARYLTQENQRIIREAQEKAEAILEEAEQKAAQKVAENEITRRAEEQAKLLLEKARQKALEIRQSAEAYAHDILQGLQGELERLASIVGNGKVKLEKDRETARADEIEKELVV